MRRSNVIALFLNEIPQQSSPWRVFQITCNTKKVLKHTEQLRWPSGKIVRLESCKLGFDSKSGQTNGFKIVFTASLLDAQH